MGNWAPGDMHAAYVAVFILLIAWFLTMIPKFRRSAMSRTSGDDEPARRSSSHHAYAIARDAVLWLVTAVTISFAGKANQAATNALAYIFMAIMLVTIGLAYFVRSKIVLTSMQMLAWSLALALVIMAFASANGRYLVQ